MAVWKCSFYSFSPLVATAATSKRPTPLHLAHGGWIPQITSPRPGWRKDPGAAACCMSRSLLRTSPRLRSTVGKANHLCWIDLDLNVGSTKTPPLGTCCKFLVWSKTHKNATVTAGWVTRLCGKSGCSPSSSRSVSVWPCDYGQFL